MLKTFFSLACSLFLSLFFLLSFTANPEAADQHDTPTQGFPEKLHQTYRRALSGDFDQAFGSFEEMIKSNPREFVAYDFYAQALEQKALLHDSPAESRETYEKAIILYQTWLDLNGTRDSSHATQAAERIGEIKKKQEFINVVTRATPWERVEAYEEGLYTIKSNLPREYCLEVVAELQKIIHDEIEILSSIFGSRADEEKRLKVFIAGSWEDYKKALEKIAAIQPPRPKRATYFPEAGILVILFDGSLDKRNLAGAIAHHLIRTNYIKNPSRLLEIGLTEYLAYQLAKKEAAAQILSRLEFLNWLYEQGEWEWPFPSETDRFKSLEAYYLRAWALIYFLIEGGKESFTQIFKKYLDYEMDRNKNNDQTFQQFFEKNLTDQGMHDLRDQWQSFTLSLSYKKI